MAHPSWHSAVKEKREVCSSWSEDQLSSGVTTGRVGWVDMYGDAARASRIVVCCIDLGLNCCVMHRFGVKLLRSASIGGQTATLCIDCVPNCCVPHRFGVEELLRSA